VARAPCWPCHPSGPAAPPTRPAMPPQRPVFGVFHRLSELEACLAAGCLPCRPDCYDRDKGLVFDCVLEDLGEAPPFLRLPCSFLPAGACLPRILWSLAWEGRRFHAAPTPAVESMAHLLLTFPFRLARLFSLPQTMRAGMPSPSAPG
jgi:hypothetical protein